MAEKHDEMGFRDKAHIVLRGPDGQIKDERNIQEVTDNEQSKD